jgi:hypothetical protein
MFKNANQSKMDLEIVFDNVDSLNIINDFLLKNGSIKNLYLEKDYLVNIDLFEKNFDTLMYLVDCIEKSSILIANSKIFLSKPELFDNINIWNVSICTNIFFNLPFTLKNIIYLPLDYIIKCQNKIKNFSTNDLILTLIHEKIHLGQRINLNNWNKYISENNSSWIKLQPKPNFNFNSDSNLIMITNPDTWYEDFTYAYIYLDPNTKSNNLIWGNFFYNKQKKNIEKKYFFINLKNNNLIKQSVIELEQEHPFEYYAYELSKQIKNHF